MTTFRLSAYDPKNKYFKFSDVYGRAKKNALNRNIEFTLTTKEFNKLVEVANGFCTVSGIEFSSKHNSGFGKRKPFAPSLDRIDSSKGYTKKNCRLVCILVNMAMNEWGEKPFLEVCKVVYKRHLAQKDLKGEMVAN